jgi:2-polyprenyl-6-methoxyphenol hydroxylase-like FAD-dependent oxidoreductase
MADHEKRAIVIGGSVAGVLAARVLSEHFAHVTVLERDALSEEVREGVPQAQHAHGLLAGGLAALESLFPGFAEAARTRGGKVVDVGEFASWTIDGVQLPSMQTGLRGLLMSRVRLEQLLRQRLSHYGNVALRPNARVSALTGHAWQITGVRLDSGQELPADLVVDASGRSSDVPRMLRRFGLKPPSEERVKMELRCTSCVVTRKAQHLEGRDGYVYTPTAPVPRGGSALALGEDRYLVTLIGYLGAHAPRSYRGMIEFARALPDRTLYTLLRDAEPIGEPVELRHPGSVRVRYDRMRHRPRGLLALGDAFCSINPAYGYGMTIAALEVHALRRALGHAEPRTLAQRFFSEAARIVDIPWSMVAGADFEFDGARGTEPPPHPSIRAYFKRALRAALGDSAVALAVYRVMHLIDPPSALFAPNLVGSVLGQREAPPPAPAPCLMLVPDRS